MHFPLWIIVVALFLLFAAGLFFLTAISADGNSRRRPRRKAPQEKEQDQRDWKRVALRLEKHISDMRLENMDWQKTVRKLEKESELYKAKYEDVKAALDRERGWKEKEGEESDKKGKRMKYLEEELARMERRAETEHIELLALRRDNAKLKETADILEEGRKAQEARAEKIQAQSDAWRQEILDLRVENKKLSRRHEDTQWIAKSAHLRVKEELRKKTEELERLKKEHQGL